VDLREVLVERLDEVVGELAALSPAPVKRSIHQPLRGSRQLTTHKQVSAGGVTGEYEVLRQAVDGGDDAIERVKGEARPPQLGLVACLLDEHRLHFPRTLRLQLHQCVAT
jgi:hypothetical protein